MESQDWARTRIRTFSVQTRRLHRAFISMKTRLLNMNSPLMAAPHRASHYLLLRQQRRFLRGHLRYGNQLFSKGMASVDLGVGDRARDSLLRSALNSHQAGADHDFLWTSSSLPPCLKKAPSFQPRLPLSRPLSLVTGPSSLTPSPRLSQHPLLATP